MSWPARKPALGRPSRNAPPRARLRPGGVTVAGAAGTWAGVTVAGVGQTGTTGVTAGTTGATAGITSGTTGNQRPSRLRHADLGSGRKALDRDGRRPADPVLQH